MELAISFDRAADYYDETRGFPSGIAPQVADLLVALGHLDSSSRVLEIGIGTGRIALPLAPHAASITGVDLSRLMMDQLRKKPDAGSIYLMQGDARRLPLSAHAFDAAVIVHVLHLMEGWQTAVEQLARVLRPEASLLIGWGGQGHYELWREVHNRSKVDRDHRPGPSREEILAHFAEQGWRDHGSQKLTFAHRLAPRQIIEYLKDRVWSSSWQYTPAEHQAVMTALQEVLSERYDDLDAPAEFEGNFTAYAFHPPA